MFGEETDTGQLPEQNRRDQKTHRCYHTQTHTQMLRVLYLQIAPVGRTGIRHPVNQEIPDATMWN